MAVTVVLIAFAVSVAILFYWRGRRVRHLLSQIPGPSSVPVFGATLKLLIPRHELLPLSLRWSRKYGPVMRVDGFMGDLRIILSGPEACQAMLFSKNNLKKDNSYNFMKPWLGTGLLTSTGNKWRCRRKMLDPAFHYKILEDFVPVFNANSAILVDKLQGYTRNEYVEINNLVALCALDNICETAMGASVHAQSGKGVDYVYAVNRMCHFLVERHFSPWLQPDWIFYLTSLGREEKKIVKTLQDFSGKIIRQKSKEHKAKKSTLAPSQDSKKRLSFLDMLLEMSNQDGELSDDVIREEVNTFMFAGHDTTAAAMSWALFLLGAHQDVQEKVASELIDIFGSDRRQPTMADLNSMTYLDKVIKEVLRLFPSVPVVSRILDTEVTVGEYTIPAGYNVMVSPFLLHRNPNVYPDPEQFDPERFSPEQSAGRHPFAYIPFSAGPRNCIGQKFARFEMLSVLSSIFLNFKLESLGKVEDVKIRGDIIMKPLEPFKIKISARH